MNFRPAPHGPGLSGVLQSFAQVTAHPDALVTLTDAAVFLGVGRRSVEELVRQGDLPIVRISPRRIGIRLGDLSAFIESRRQVRTAA